MSMPLVRAVVILCTNNRASNVLNGASIHYRHAGTPSLSIKADGRPTEHVESLLAHLEGRILQ
jgi:hypothetical protein